MREMSLIVLIAIGLGAAVIGYVSHTFLWHNHIECEKVVEQGRDANPSFSHGEDQVRSSSPDF